MIIKYEKKEFKLFFEIIAYIICCYELNININYTGTINNKTVRDFLIKTSLKINDNVHNFYKNNCNFYSNFIYLSNSIHTKCLIIRKHSNKNKMYIIFNGTQLSFSKLPGSYYDIINDLKISLCQIDKNDPNIKVHSGYYDCLFYDNLFEQICNEIANNYCRDIYIGGHSMGAAIGCIFTYLISKKFKNKKFNLIMISSPKVGNNFFKDSIEKNSNINIFNIFNNHDIVQIFPFIGNYCNIGKKTLILNNNSTFKIVDDIKVNIFTNYSIKDHKLYTTLNNLFDCYNLL